MRYLLDTCAISELAKANINSEVHAWALAQNELNFYISALTLGELQKGVAKLATGNKKSQLQVWIKTDLSQRFTGRILPVDIAVCLLWGEVHASAESLGKPMPIVDALIAATALHYQLTVVTRNTRDMEASGALLFNPWKPL